MRTILLTATVPNEPPLFIMLPFALLLLCIAVGPLIGRHHWERYYHLLCVALAAIPSGYYLLVLGSGARLLHVAFEYFSFMVVIGSFFVVTGGIHIVVQGRARPLKNAIFLALGGILGNVIGTTGASMLLIRPWIRMNRYRFTGLHLACFIFLVSNIGGALLPTGPPLFLGYLKGVPFWWGLQRCWLPWGVTFAAVLLIFYFVDRHNFRRCPVAVREETAASERWRFDGLRNVGLMFAILGALILVPFGWRELIMIIAAVTAFLWTPRRVYLENQFTFAPIKEVGWIFLGIFGTIVPVLDYMEMHARELGLHSDLQFYWFTGLLSGILDNAPTYLTFLAGALGLEGFKIGQPEQVAAFIHHSDHYLIAISLGATCFGALTYIGNGPNLMVKAIADQAKVRSPNFFACILKFALPVLLPVFVLVSLLFFRH
jgi:Na+/H+ antiporter NhaD/arsenite permease-like protein